MRSLEKIYMEKQLKWSLYLFLSADSIAIVYDILCYNVCQEYNQIRAVLPAEVFLELPKDLPVFKGAKDRRQFP